MAWHIVPPVLLQRSPNWMAWWSLYAVSARILMVWLYNNTFTSVFAVALFRAMLNLACMLFPVDGSHFDMRLGGLAMVFAAAVGAPTSSDRVLLSGCIALQIVTGLTLFARPWKSRRGVVPDSCWIQGHLCAARALTRRGEARPTTTSLWCKALYIAKRIRWLARLLRVAGLDDQVEACRRVFASDTQWTVVRASHLDEGETQAKRHPSTHHPGELQ